MIRNAKIQRQHRQTALILIAAIVLFIMILTIFGDRSSALHVRQRLAVPAYFFPNEGWGVITNDSKSVGMAILNIDSGSGSAKSESFASAVSAARSAGVRVLGYVDTNYGLRSMSQVLADVANFRNWYGIDGIFLDQTPAGCSLLSYYSQIFSVVHVNANGFVAINPGMNPAECFTSVSDLIVNFEGTASSYAVWSPSAWTSKYNPELFWHIVYDVPTTAYAQTIQLSQSRNVANIYLTDDLFPNPFDRLPADWNALTQLVLGADNSGPSTTSAPTPSSFATTTTGSVTSTTNWTSATSVPITAVSTTAVPTTSVPTPSVPASTTSPTTTSAPTTTISPTTTSQGRSAATQAGITTTVPPTTRVAISTSSLTIGGNTPSSTPTRTESPQAPGSTATTRLRAGATGSSTVPPPGQSVATISSTTPSPTTSLPFAVGYTPTVTTTTRAATPSTVTSPPTTTTVRSTTSVAPTTAAPTTSVAPTTAAPTSLVPTTSAPTTSAPTTTAPTTTAPTSSTAPTTSRPSVTTTTLASATTTTRWTSATVVPRPA